MVLQVGLFAESSLTDVALERPSSCVDVHVTLQVSRGGEGFGTEGALVVLLL